MRFKKLNHECLISPKFNNGEFAYWLVIKTFEWAEYVGEREAPDVHNTTIYAVAPSQVPPDKLARAMAGGCLEEGSPLLEDPLVQVELLLQYGIAAPVWQRNGNQLRQLLHDAKQECELVEPLLGFYLDKPVNALGATGWDWIKGDCEGERFRQYCKEKRAQEATSAE